MGPLGRTTCSRGTNEASADVTPGWRGIAVKRITSESQTERTERVKKLRDATLRLVERHGKLEPMEFGPVETVSHGGFYAISTTPFLRRPVDSDVAKYQRALQVARGAPEPLEHPYGIDLWVDLKKVLDLEWDAAGQIDVISFKRGAWEDELLALAEPEEQA
jgi:hypothetical protein